MTDSRAANAEDPNQDQTDGPAIAEGVDEEPVERNRRLFTGWSYGHLAAISTIYAAFHMLALNGVSISE